MALASSTSKIGPLRESVAGARDESAVMPVDVREGTKAIELQLEEPVGMVERLLNPHQGHRAELHVRQLLRWFR
jgi:hypothetical protein